MSIKILITGCSGLVGHGICLHLLKEGYEIWGTSRKQKQSHHKNFRAVQLDLTVFNNIMEFSSLLDEIDIIIHNAVKIFKNGRETEKELDEYFQVNFLGTYALLKLAEKKNIKKFIFISTTSCVDQSVIPILEETPYKPINEYVSSKIMGEIVCRQFHTQQRIQTIILRIRAPYGYMSTKRAVIPLFIDKVRNHQNIILWGSGKREQVFTFVEDIGLACQLAIESPKTGIFNITGPMTTTMKDLAEHILTAFPKSRSKILFSGKKDPQEGKRVRVSIEKVRRELSYIPRFDLKAGLEKIANPKDFIYFFES